MWGWGPWSGVGLVVGLVGLVLLTGVVVLFAVSARGGRGRWAAPPDDVAELLAQRFARGDIDEQEYRRRLAVLEEGPGAAG